MAYLRIKRAVLLAVGMVFLPFCGMAGETCDAYFQRQPERVQELFSKLDLTQPSLQEVARAVKEKRWVDACHGLLNYYRLRFPELRDSWSPLENEKEQADKILGGEFKFQGVTAVQPSTADGHLDWRHQGPKDDPEWAWMLNRHFFFYDLLWAWRSTGRSKYAEGFDRYVRDWVESNPAPMWADDSGPWRPMEVGRRLSDTWPNVFYGFQFANEFEESTRLMMLLSVAEQADFCMRHHMKEGNHLNAEMVGLASAAVYWPEFKDSQKWLNYAVRVMRKELVARVYPDGVQQELAHHYQIIVARHADRMASLLLMANHPAKEEFRTLADKLWNYVYLVSKPDGTGPLNNDSDVEQSSQWLAFAANLRSLSRWSEKGGESSTFFRWAGQIVMRDGRGANSDWMFFDVGPLGIAHQHYDKLHVSLFTGGHDVLVDGGRFTYMASFWRRYFAGPQAHNVVLLDGASEIEDLKVSRKPVDAVFVSRPEADFAMGEVKFKPYSLSDQPVHRRAIIYVKGEYWLISDEVVSFEPHRVVVPWHFHPSCALEKEGLTVNELQSGVRLMPVNARDWKFQVMRGRKRPVIQGWWSPHYNEKLPSPVALYRREIDRPTSFGWLIVKNHEQAQVEEMFSRGGMYGARVTHPGGRVDEITVDFHRGRCTIRRAGTSPLILE